MTKRGWWMTGLWMLAALLGFGGVTTGVQAGQILVLEQSEIFFTGRQMGVPMQGRFQKFSVDAAIDLAALETSRARLAIDTDSVALPARDFTTEIKRRRWFDTANFPEAVFEANQFRALGENRYEASGTLTLKGVSQEIVVPLTLVAEGGDLLAEGQFELKRLDFNIGDGPWADTDTVADEVQVRFKLRLQPRS
jgi:polyisoprenoid-binding protein YceI